MASLSLLTLLDDITTVLDDVALMSKVAAKKTTGLLGDDLALTSEQVAGVKADREIPVVLAVAKGSFRNKFMLVPAALLISAFVPWLIKPILLLGGLYLSYEGVEKVLHSMQQPKVEKGQLKSPQRNSRIKESVEEYEKKKVAGAIRTDFILSAEIIVIALSTVTEYSIPVQILVVSLIAIIMTIGVYGLVAAIVRLDDLGLYLLRHYKSSKILSGIGRSLLSFAPKLMKVLTVVGTVAMFLVGGGIVAHTFPAVHHLIEPVLTQVANVRFAHSLIPLLYNAVIGVVAGSVLVMFHSLYAKLKHR